MANLTGEEITALADTLDTAAQDERDYILGTGGAADYTDEEWPEVAEIKATRWEILAGLMNKMGQTGTADLLEELAKDIRATLEPPVTSPCECGREYRFCSTYDGGEVHGDR